MTVPARTSDTLIVVPMKDPRLSKSRLKHDLTASERQALAQKLFVQTLLVLKDAAALTRFDVAVVTGCEEVRDMTVARGLISIPEGFAKELTSAVQVAADWAQDAGYARICILPADLADPKPEEISRLLESPAEVTICPADDLGTNALLVTPPTAIEFSYGKRSAVRHFEAAERAGLQPMLMPLGSLKHDIDTADCLQRAIELRPELCKSWGQ